MHRSRLLAVVAASAMVACGSSASSPAQSADAGVDVGVDAFAIGAPDSAADADATIDAPVDPSAIPEAGESGAAVGLAAKYPCDKGLAADPAVLWLEDFEEGSVGAVTARYDSANDPPGMALVPDVPARTCGKASMKLTSGTSANATDLYKKIVPAHDEWFVRWYAKYQAGVQWHHTGVWIGGYAPPSAYPNPQAGLKPDGDDRFSVSIEPVWNVGMPNPRLDYYNYWMKMQSWMAQPQGTTAYYGNSLVHQTSFTADDDTWMCLELHVKLNTDVTSSAGAVLEVWKNDALVQRFDEAAPTGCWVRDKFCVPAADGPECTMYPDLCAKPYVPLDLQWRSTASLQLDAFWPQNYITSGPDGSVQFDEMVVATSRVGCLAP